MKEYACHTESAKGIYSGSMFFDTRKEACEFAKKWSEGGDGTREIIIMEMDESGFDYVWSAKYADGVREY
jgi:hypothetical protein